MLTGKNKPLLVMLCLVAVSGVASLAWSLFAWQTSGTSDRAIILFFYGVLVLSFLSTSLAFSLRPKLLQPVTPSTCASPVSDAPPEYRDTWRQEYMKKIRHEASPEEAREATGVEVGGRIIVPNDDDERLPPYSLCCQDSPTLQMAQDTATATELQRHGMISQPHAYTADLDRLAWMFSGASQTDMQTNHSQPNVNTVAQDPRLFPGASRFDTQTRTSQPEGTHTGNRHRESRLSTGRYSRVGRYTFGSQPDSINTTNHNQRAASRASTYTSSSQPDLHAANQDRQARVSTRRISRLDDPTYETASSGESLFLKAMLHTASSHPA